MPLAAPGVVPGPRHAAVCHPSPPQEHEPRKSGHCVSLSLQHLEYCLAHSICSPKETESSGWNGMEIQEVKWMDWREQNGIELVKLELEFWSPDSHIMVQATKKPKPPLSHPRTWGIYHFCLQPTNLYPKQGRTGSLAPVGVQGRRSQSLALGLEDREPKSVSSTRAALGREGQLVNHRWRDRP